MTFGGFLMQQFALDSFSAHRPDGVLFVGLRGTAARGAAGQLATTISSVANRTPAGPQSTRRCAARSQAVASKLGLDRRASATVNTMTGADLTRQRCRAGRRVSWSEVHRRDHPPRRRHHPAARDHPDHRAEVAHSTDGAGTGRPLPMFDPQPRCHSPHRWRSTCHAAADRRVVRRRVRRRWCCTTGATRALTRRRLRRLSIVTPAASAATS